MQQIHSIFLNRRCIIFIPDVQHGINVSRSGYCSKEHIPGPMCMFFPDGEEFLSTEGTYNPRRPIGYGHADHHDQTPNLEAPPNV